MIEKNTMAFTIRNTSHLTASKSDIQRISKKYN